MWFFKWEYICLEFNIFIFTKHYFLWIQLESGNLLRCWICIIKKEKRQCILRQSLDDFFAFNMKTRHSPLKLRIPSLKAMKIVKSDSKELK